MCSVILCDENYVKCQQVKVPLLKDMSFLLINCRKTFAQRNNLRNAIPLKQLCYSVHIATFRSSRPELFCKKRVLENCTKFTGK